MPAANRATSNFKCFIQFGFLPKQRTCTPLSPLSRWTIRSPFSKCDRTTPAIPRRQADDKKRPPGRQTQGRGGGLAVKPRERKSHGERPRSVGDPARRRERDATSRQSPSAHSFARFEKDDSDSLAAVGRGAENRRLVRGLVVHSAKGNDGAGLRLLHRKRRIGAVVP